MKTILFILLLTISQAKNWNEFVEGKYYIKSRGEYYWERDEGFLDEWSGASMGADSIYSTKNHYKAILFFEEESLRRYMEKYNPKGILIDLRKGCTVEYKIEPIKETITEKKEIIKDYKFRIIGGEK